MTLPEPHFDSDGYPTEEFLELLATFSIIDIDPYDIPDYIFDIWHWGEMMGKVENKTDANGEEYLCFQISTGGWSGNESIIGALKKSMFWMCFWYRSQCGGHYWFRIKRFKK